jgi:hypothetical protein
MQKQSIMMVSAVAVSALMLGCGAPALLFVDNVQVERPSSSKDPQLITLPFPVSAAIDSLKLDLIHRGFTIKEADNRLGIIQTDDKLLGKDELFEYRYSEQQRAATGLLAGAFLAGFIITAVATADDQKNCDDSHDYHHDHVEETKPDIVQTKGRLQIIASKGGNSTHSILEMTAYISTYTNGVKGEEEKAIRLHPFIQKHTCFLEHRNCGKAPGQNIIQPKATSALPVKRWP